jgi:SAM-dependent methyltransferase
MSDDMAMERLSLDIPPERWRLEAALHLGRYAVALPFAEGSRTLDVGCGPGYGARLIADAGAASVVGIDVSEGALMEAASLRVAGMEFVRLRAEDAASLGTHRFDLITCMEVIEHVADPVEVLRAIREVARDDATVLISCPNDHWYYEADDAGNPFHERRFTMDEFRHLSESVLGPASVWGLGVGYFGMMTLPLGEMGMIHASPRSWPGALSEGRAWSFRPSATSTPDPASSGYYLGVWGLRAAKRFSATVCGFPLSMNGVDAAIASGLVDDGESELAFLRARTAALDEALAAQAAMIDERDAVIRTLDRECARLSEAASPSAGRPPPVGLRARLSRRLRR